MRLARKTVRPRLSKWFANVGRWDMIASLAGSDTKNALLLARVFQDKFHQYDCSEKLSAQGPRPAKVSKPWPMGHWQGARLKEQSCWHGFFRTNSINTIVPKNWCQRLFKRCLNAGQRDMPDMYGKKFFAGGVFILHGVLSVDAWFSLLCSEAD